MTRHSKLVIAAALLFDLLLGDPPNRWHPVAWMGTLIAHLRQRAPRHGYAAAFVYGGLISPGGAWLIGIGGALCSHLCERLPAPLNWLTEGYLLKVCLSLRGLNNAAYAVEKALAADDLPEARRVLSWHLVSRDTTGLDAARVAAAAVESVAENTSDGIAAPLIYYAVGGLPLAFAYRFANTADSMLGYRDSEREWLGKLPARFDDLLNLIPSRLTAVSIVGAALLAGTKNGSRAWHIWQRDASKTASPNAGQSMSAMAGAIGVELEKVGHYTLGKGERLPTTQDIRRARHLMYAAVGLLLTLLLLFPERRP